MRIALTTMVMMPIGPTASNMLSAHPIEEERNCFMACSPKRVMSGPTDELTVLIKSDQSVASTGEVGEGVGVFVVVAGAIFSTV